MDFRSLPLAARGYVLAVILAGVALAAWAAMHGPLHRPLAFLAFLLASVIVATVKIKITEAASTFSIGYAVSFAALVLLDMPAAIWIVMAGAYAQCTVRVKVRSPWYQTAFSVSVLALSMAAAGVVLDWTGGHSVYGPADIVIPSIMASSLAYFLTNSLLMATVIALTTARTPMQVWDHDFLWGAPNYFSGALVATVSIQSVTRFGLPSVIILAVLAFLTFRIYTGYVRRLDEALTDPLTRLPNRRSLASQAEVEIARASRAGQPFAVVMADVDRFKQINDTYGHQKGDELLGLIADGFRRNLRPYDFCARYAGDEFVVILPGCDAELAAHRAEDIAMTIAALPLALANGEKSPVSVSLGVAAFPADGKTYEDLLAVADARMYRRKAQEKKARDAPAAPAGATDTTYSR
jgi:diguanylate cyclase (GGDEF)-like protein